MALKNQTIFTNPLTRTSEKKIHVSPQEIENIREEGYKEGIKQAEAEQIKNEKADLLQEGRRQAIKETTLEGIKEKEKSIQKLQRLNEGTDRVLLRISSLFPFDFFPDEVTIDQVKVNVVIRTFFLTGRTQSIYIRDIIDIIVETTFFFATLRVIDTGYAQNHLVISFLKKSDAQKARRIIQGLILAYKEGIDVSKLNAEQLSEIFESIGAMKKEEDTK